MPEIPPAKSTAGLSTPKLLTEAEKREQAKRDSVRRQYLEIENKRQRDLERNNKYQLTDWERVEGPLPAANPADVSLSSRDIKEPLTEGQWKVSFYAENKRKEMVMVVDKDGNISIPYNGNSDIRLGSYRAAMRMYGAGIGYGRLTLNFPRLSDEALKSHDTALSALNFNEVKSLLNIAKEEGVEIVVEKGSQFDKWVGQLNNDERQAINGLREECKQSYEARVAGIKPKDDVSVEEIKAQLRSTDRSQQEKGLNMLQARASGEGIRLDQLEKKESELVQKATALESTADTTVVQKEFETLKNERAELQASSVKTGQLIFEATQVFPKPNDHYVSLPADAKGKELPLTPEQQLGNLNTERDKIRDRFSNMSCLNEVEKKLQEAKGVTQTPSQKP